jgi:transcriptional regulator with XRE-family HTH domain/Zn-dependent peptidase ImmA (M78 family)
MNTTPEPASRWEEPDYQTITDVAYDGTHLVVRFANGDEARVPVGRLVRPQAGPPRWWEVRNAAHEVIVPTAGGEAEVSWMDLRAQSDPRFSEFLRQTADEEARRIGQRLRALRERRGMTAKEVAEAAGIAPLSLSRIELGRHDVVYRTLRRILAAMNFTLRDLAEIAEPELDTRSVTARLREADVPRQVTAQLSQALGDRPERLIAAVTRIFGWSRDELASAAPLPVSVAPAAIGRFKAQVNQNPALATYTMWAHWLALLVDQAIRRGPSEIPESAHAIREDVLSRYRHLRFEQLLGWCWEQGVAVLPLSDPGEFHGAVWSFDRRVVVVLKQRTPWESRWTFDLAHELGHVARHIDAGTSAVVELGEINPLATSADDDEQEANEFAGELLLGEPKTLARELAERTRHALPRLKAEVQKAARDHGVEVDALANYMAWRLDLEGENWWSTAGSLQDESGRAPLVAREALLRRINWSLLTEDDAALLRAALDWDTQQ